MSGEAERRDGPEPVEIAVCTCRRPDGLERLLRGIAALELDRADRPVRVLVVDNAPDGRAAEVCRRLASALPWPLRCVEEPVPGLVPARNRVLDALDPETALIAMLDDDEVPEPGWLRALLETMTATGADAVTGPVEPVFEIQPPPWAREGPVFRRASRPTGTRLDRAFTHNVLVRRDRLGADGLRFDPRYSRSGGEDAQLFRRAHALGWAIVWCDEAVVREHVPAGRLEVGWMLRRTRRIASVVPSIERDLDGRATVRVLARAAESIASAPLTLVRGRPWRGATRIEALRRLVYGLGLLEGLLGRRHTGYGPPAADEPITP